MRAITYLITKSYLDAGEIFSFIFLLQTCSTLFLGITRAVASLSSPVGQDRNISSICPHFPVFSRPPGKALATPIGITKLT